MDKAFIEENKKTNERLLNKEDKLLVEKEYKLFFKYLTPNLIGAIFLGMIGFLDAALIGRGVGASGLVVISIALPVYTLYWALGYLIGLGGATVASIDEGRGIKNRNRLFTTSLLLAGIISVFLTVVQNLYLDEFVRFLGASSETFIMTKSYLRIVSLGTALYIIPFVLFSFIRNDCNPNLYMIGMMVCNIVNLSLDYVFMFIFKWGIVGAAMATVISEIFLILVSFAHFFKKDSELGLRKIELRFGEIKKIITVGMSSFINEMSNGIIVFIFNIYFMRYGGDLAVSAYSIIANLNFLIYLAYAEVGQAIQPLISYNYGSSQSKREKKFLQYGLIFNGILSILALAFIVYFPEKIVKIFSEDNFNLIKLTSSSLIKYFSATIFMGINMIYTVYFQAKGYGKTASIITSFRSFFLVIIGIVSLSNLIGLNGLWYSVLFAEGITFAGILLYSGKKEIIKEIL